MLAPFECPVDVHYPENEASSRNDRLEVANVAECGRVPCDSDIEHFDPNTVGMDSRSVQDVTGTFRRTPTKSIVPLLKHDGEHLNTSADLDLVKNSSLQDPSCSDIATSKMSRLHIKSNMGTSTLPSYPKSPARENASSGAARLLSDTIRDTTSSFRSTDKVNKDSQDLHTNEENDDDDEEFMCITPHPHHIPTHAQYGFDEVVDESYSGTRGVDYEICYVFGEWQCWSLK